ncbi:MAG: AAA family ATPase [Rhodocyclaceae bacterium]|nr:AAA family ATPase [Rhodocyclaceae bacterium]
MNSRYGRGLVVGKFCPLHLGHEWLITQAQASCDRLIVLSYTVPGFPGYEAARRERWLLTRFPEIQVVVIDQQRLSELCAAREIGDVPCLPADAAHDDEHRQFVAWLCLHLLQTTVDVVFSSEDYGDGFAKVLSRHFGHTVDHVCVDKQRSNAPVSGTVIRSNPWAYRHYLSPEVYASFVRRIAILGGESSGKTTLTEALAERMGAHWVPEYGRERWEAQSGRLAFEDMLHIAQTQVFREETFALHANKWLVCDTTPLTTLFYCDSIFHRAPQELEHLAERRYDLTIICAPDFPFVQDGTRQTAAFRLLQHTWYLTRLSDKAVSFHQACGNLSERLRGVERLIDEYVAPVLCAS